jgi:hypothetical protein
MSSVIGEALVCDMAILSLPCFGISKFQEFQKFHNPTILIVLNFGILGILGIHY